MKQLLLMIETMPKRSIWALVFLILMGISLTDYYTGFELSFSIFYLLPTALVAWTLGRNSGLLISSVCATLWLVSNKMAGESHSSPFVMYWNAGTRLGFFVLVTLLLVELHSMLRNERHMARTDPLTGALNRRGFQLALESELYRSQRNQQIFSLLYMDLDNFKAVNDQQGHDAGDAVLQLVLASLSDNLRRSDQIARLGGDEFAILLHETNVAQVKELIPRLQEQLNQVLLDQNYPVTCSIGVVTCLDFSVSVADIVQAADQLMYRVKREGKNAIAFRTLPSD